MKKIRMICVLAAFVGVLAVFAACDMHTGIRAASAYNPTTTVTPAVPGTSGTASDTTQSRTSDTTQNRTTTGNQTGTTADNQNSMNNRSGSSITVPDNGMRSDVYSVEDSTGNQGYIVIIAENLGNVNVETRDGGIFFNLGGRNARLRNRGARGAYGNFQDNGQFFNNDGLRTQPYPGNNTTQSAQNGVDARYVMPNNTHNGTNNTANTNNTTTNNQNNTTAQSGGNTVNNSTVTTR